MAQAIGVAVVGCGWWGRNLVRNCRELGALRCVCDSTETGRRDAGQLAPDVPVVSVLSEALECGVDAVVIATPAETHFEIARSALAAGKDVFVEKPITLDLEQGAWLVREARTKGRILMVGHVLEYHPGVVALADMVQSGRLGRVQYVYSHRLSLGKIRREENALWSFAPHDIAVIVRLMGGMPIQVTATGGSYVQPNIADVTLTSLLFDNGVRAHIHVSWLHPFKEQRLVVVGSKRMASFDDVAKKLVLYDQRVELHEGMPVPIKGEGELVAYASDEPLRQEMTAFLEAIRTRRPPVTDGESGLRVLRVLHAAQRSLMTNGVPVALSMESAV
ncbi:MAG: Gfo/Idh/MocA family oxidoreductase [Armatimonadetes bacterium]|nr:Gfo/Idh/MocA family oxidoreductase [Armatimonadota bacterium]